MPASYVTKPQWRNDEDATHPAIAIDSYGVGAVTGTSMSANEVVIDFTASNALKKCVGYNGDGRVVVWVSA